MSIPESLTLEATLVGRASTANDHIQVTLLIGQTPLQLLLPPDQAQLFPELVHQSGGRHAIFDPARIEYTNLSHKFTLTISPLAPTTPPAAQTAAAGTGPGPKVAKE